MRALYCGFAAIALLGCVDETPEECFREVRCVETCGGPETSAGCGACPAGMIDTLTCEPEGDAGSDAASCAPLGSACDAVSCCGGQCCVVIPEGGAGGYLCYETRPAEASSCL